MKLEKTISALLLLCAETWGRRPALPAVRMPHEMADARKGWNQTAPPRQRVLVDDSIVQDFPPPGTKVRLPAEYEPISAVVMSAQYELASMYEIVTLLLNYTNVDVYLIDGPQDLVESDNYHPLVGVPSDSVWTRDYGPVGVLVSSDDDPPENEESLVILDNLYYPGRINDEAVSCEIANLYSDWPCIVTNFYFEGGNHLIDDQGNFYMTEITYEWPELSFWTRDEVDAIIKRLFGVKNVYALPYARAEDGGRFPYDTAHLDMMASIVRPCKVVVSETTAPAWKAATDAIAAFFANQTCGENDEKYQVFRTPAWFQPLGDDPEPTIWYTYANSLLANDLVLVPEFSGNKTQNEEAIAVYQEVCPECIVSGVNMDGFITLSGAVHCMTRQLPLAFNAPSTLEKTSIPCEGVLSPSCDVSSLSEACMEQMSALNTALTEEACHWQTVAFEHNCCSDLSLRELVVPPTSPSSQLVEVLAFLDDKPFETSWLILDERSGEVIASSPIFNTTYDFVANEVALPPGSYVFLLTDLGGDIDLTPNENETNPSFTVFSEEYGSLVYSEVLGNYYKAGPFVLGGSSPEPSYEVITPTRVTPDPNSCDGVGDDCHFLFWTGVQTKTNYLGRCVQQCDFLRISHLYGWQCGRCDDNDE